MSRISADAQRFESPADSLHFVFLQGMPSSFFSRVARRLEAFGCRATGINLCMGDRIFWTGPETVNYRGTLEDWPNFIARFFDTSAVSDLVLLGEQRRYHREAIVVAQKRGIRVTVTDFGYLRPDWITLERDGMTGQSRFPRNRDELMRLAADAPSVDLDRQYEDSQLRMAVHDIVYQFGNVLGDRFYPHYRRTDRRPDMVKYLMSSARRMLVTRLRRERMRRRAQALFAEQGPTFVLPLQLSHDFQIVAYSKFAHMADVIEFVVSSFASRAPDDAKLLVKLHPWDPGTDDLEHVTLDCARRRQIADRVVFVDGGDLDRMMRGCAGVVTVNSTSGLRALQLGKPVVVLGEAVYDVPGLTHRGGLDDFWNNPCPPDPTLAAALVAAMAATIQIRGVFFKEPGLSAAVDAVAARLYQGRVGVSLSAIEALVTSP